MKIETYTISERHKTFVWLPPKCATHLISWILSYFEFSSVYMDTETNQIHKTMLNRTTHFGHNTMFPPNHEELLFICAIRNPYDRILSLYQSHAEDPSVLNFEKFVNERIIKINHIPSVSLFGFSSLLKDRMPNYLIRTENLYDDIIKIPFIKNSDLYSSSVLKNFCDKKINKSYNQLNPEEYLTPHIKEMIYNISSDHFDLFGYQR
jgi:hypothetical protein